MMHDGWGFDGGFGIAGGIIMTVFWVAVLVGVIVLVIWLIRQVQAGGSTSAGAGSTGVPAAQTPLDILKARYARGEIDKAEYEERRKTLTE